MDLQPQRGDDKVAIPLTFDVKGSLLKLKMSKLYIFAAVMLLAIILFIVILFIAANDDIRIGAAVVLLLILPTILRFMLVEEYKFRKSYRDLREKDFTYDYSLFWSIYDSTPGMPTIFHHTFGANSIFVAFDKDVIVGKGYDADYDHYEAIANAYQMLAKKEINCIHIDYMDNVGKDSRLQNLFDNAAQCKNPELRDSIIDMLDYMQWYMSGTYSDYDVYCFTSKLRPDLFIDELMPVLSAFEAGNYIRYRILDRQDVRDVVASVFAVPDFSVTRSCDNLFSNKGLSRYLRIIWTETDGEREIVNKTKAQMAEEQRIAREEKEAKKMLKRNKGKLSDAEIDLFSEDTDDIEIQASADTPSAFSQLAASAPNNSFGQANRGSFQTMTPVFENTRANVSETPTDTYVSDSKPVDFSDIDFFGDTEQDNSEQTGITQETNTELKPFGEVVPDTTATANPEMTDVNIFGEATEDFFTESTEIPELKTSDSSDTETGFAFEDEFNDTASEPVPVSTDSNLSDIAETIVSEDISDEDDDIGFDFEDVSDTDIALDSSVEEVKFLDSTETVVSEDTTDDDDIEIDFDNEQDTNTGTTASTSPFAVPVSPFAPPPTNPFGSTDTATVRRTAVIDDTDFDIDFDESESQSSEKVITGTDTTIFDTDDFFS